MARLGAEAVNFRTPGASERGSWAYSQSGGASSGRVDNSRGAENHSTTGGCADGCRGPGSYKGDVKAHRR